MSRIARAALFLLVFVVDVRLKAAETVALPNGPEILQEPAGCVLQSSVCAVMTRNDEKYKFRVGEATVTMDSGSTVIRLSENEVTLVKGTVWVRSPSAFTVRTEFGAARTDSGEAWVSRDDEKMYVSATDNAVRLEPRNSGASLRLEPGEENWIGRVVGDGRAASGVPRAIPIQDHIRRWARLYPGTKRAFEKDVRKFASAWSRGLASVAEYHHQLAEKRLEAIRVESERRARIKAQEEAESREMRALFRRKVLLD